MAYFPTGSFYAWDSRVFRAVSILTRAEQLSSAGPHLFIVAEVKSSSKYFAEALIDENVTGKEVTTCLSDP